MVPAAAVLEHELADVGLAAAVDDGFAGGVDGFLLVGAPHAVDGDVGLGENAVDVEAVGGPDGVFVAQVEHGEVFVDGGAALDLFQRLGGVFLVEVDALGDVVQGEYLVDGVVAAVVDQIHHQGVVADAEVAEAAEARAGVHHVVEQHPALGVVDFI